MTTEHTPPYGQHVARVNTLPYGRDDMRKPRSSLTATDWIQAAFRALSEGGPQAIRAEAIARALKVSKGSFYWHFKDVPDLKRQMLDHWRDQATEAIISYVDGTGGSGRERLQSLVNASTGGEAEAYGGVQVEAAIRDWGRYDPAVREALKSVDQRRLRYVADLFGECGFDANASRSNANLLYGALIGLEALSVHSPIERRQELTRLLGHLAPAP